MATDGYFITGVDTAVGKTQVAAALTALLTAAGQQVTPRKPVESGCVTDPAGTGLLPADGRSLQLACGEKEDLQRITPYRYPQPLSPERAAVVSQQPLSLQRLVEACASEPDTIRVIEGAGGLFSPIATAALNIDLAVALQLPLILVAWQRLGVINQVLLNHHAIETHGLELALVILNGYQPEEDEQPENLAALRQRLSCPVLPLPRLPSDTPSLWPALLSPLRQQLQSTPLRTLITRPSPSD